MAYCRWGEAGSDVYFYATEDLRWTCSNCDVHDIVSHEEAIAHLEWHRSRGEQVPPAATDRLRHEQQFGRSKRFDELDLLWCAWYPWAEQIFVWLRSAVLCPWQARWPGDWCLACSGCGGNHFSPEVWLVWPIPSPLTEPAAQAAFWGAKARK